MSKVQYIHMGSYPIYVGITDCPIAFKRELKRLKIKDDVLFVNKNTAATAHFFESDKHNNTCIICIDKVASKGKTISQKMALIVHEAVHVWQECELIMGEKNAGHEIEAYAIQWISQCCMDYIIENKK